jgi:transposase-like protein
MQCPRCQSTELVKAGLQSQKQRYKCKQCSRLFVEFGRPGYSSEFKEQALAMYLEGLGFRAIGRLLGVSNVAVLKWVRKAAQDLPPPESKAVVDVLEMDELWHFIKKRVESSGCGLRLTVNDAPLLTSRQVVVVYKP